jgi:hypothetical protein
MSVAALKSMFVSVPQFQLIWVVVTGRLHNQLNSAAPPKSL